MSKQAACKNVYKWIAPSQRSQLLQRSQLDFAAFAAFAAWSDSQTILSTPCLLVSWILWDRIYRYSEGAGCPVFSAAVLDWWICGVFRPWGAEDEFGRPDLPSPGWKIFFWRKVYFQGICWFKRGCWMKFGKYLSGQDSVRLSWWSLHHCSEKRGFLCSIACDGRQAIETARKQLQDLRSCEWTRFVLAISETGKINLNTELGRRIMQNSICWFCFGGNWYQTHRIHVWYIYLHLNIWLIIMVNVGKHNIHSWFMIIHGPYFQKGDGRNMTFSIWPNLISEFYSPGCRFFPKKTPWWPFPVRGGIRWVGSLHIPMTACFFPINGGTS